MKIKLWVMALFLGAASWGQAQVFLSVDFNGFYYNATESGFTGLAAGAVQGEAGTYPTTIGSYSLDVTSSSSLGQWQNATFTPTSSAALYKDFISASGFGTLTVTVGGLASNTDYEFRSFNWYGNAGTTGTLTFTPINGTTSTSSLPNYIGIYDGSVDITTQDQFSTLMDLTSNGSGQIVFTVSGNAWDNNVMNGFTIATVGVPEPSTIASMGLGLAFLALRLRRRSVS